MNFLIVITAKYLIFLLILLGAVFFFKQNKSQQKQLLIFGGLSLPLSYLTAKLSALFYFNPRPFVVEHFIPLLQHSADNGFPSDHVLLASAIAMVIFYYNRKVGIFFLLLSILIGIARVLSGVHHAVDILGSIVISFFITSLVYYLIIIFKKKYSPKH